jgi:hypothetical protein
MTGCYGSVGLVIRVHLTAEDIARITVVTYGPLAEVLYSSAASSGRRGQLLFGAWWRSLDAESRRQSLSLAAFGQRLNSVDLVTLAGRVRTLDQGVEAILSASPDMLQAELDESSLAISTGLPGWIQELPRRLPARYALVRVLKAYHDASVAPHWDRIQALLDSTAGAYARTLATGGVRVFLESLHPDLTWMPPFLIKTRRTDLVLNLSAGGRGLSVVPSVFCRRVMIYEAQSDPAGPLLVVVPAVRSVADAQALWHGGNGGAGRPLGALLGETRAVILDAATRGCTTSELARQAGISPATASHHATVLREAGLIATRRVGGAVLHTVTPLGVQLLNGRGSPSGPDTARPAGQLVGWASMPDS